MHPACWLCLCFRLRGDYIRFNIMQAVDSLSCKTPFGARGLARGICPACWPCRYRLRVDHIWFNAMGKIPLSFFMVPMGTPSEWPSTPLRGKKSFFIVCFVGKENLNTKLKQKVEKGKLLSGIKWEFLNPIKWFFQVPSSWSDKPPRKQERGHVTLNNHCKETKYSWSNTICWSSKLTWPKGWF